MSIGEFPFQVQLIGFFGRHTELTLERGELGSANREETAPRKGAHDPIELLLGKRGFGAKPLLLETLKQLADKEQEKKIREKVDDAIRPQIAALVEVAIQNTVQEQIMTPLDETITRMAKESLAATMAKVNASLNSMLSGLDAASIPTAVLRPMFAEKMASVEVQVGGKSVSYDVLPTLQNSRTLVPLRAIAEALGATVGFEDATKTVTLTRGATTVQLQIGNPKASVNGAPVTLDVPGIILNGRTLVPVRFISEAFGAQVNWDDFSRTVRITGGQ